jgi:hypothetical protein
MYWCVTLRDNTPYLYDGSVGAGAWCVSMVGKQRRERIRFMLMMSFLPKIEKQTRPPSLAIPACLPLIICVRQEQPSSQ